MRHVRLGHRGEGMKKLVEHVQQDPLPTRRLTGYWIWATSGYSSAWPLPAGIRAPGLAIEPADRAQELRYVGHSEVTSAYLPNDSVNDKLGEVVTSWDPLVLAPWRAKCMLPVLDAGHSHGVYRTSLWYSSRTHRRGVISWALLLGVMGGQCLVSTVHSCASGQWPRPPPGVMVPQTYKEAQAAPGSAEWAEVVNKEMESLVEIKGALDMLAPADADLTGYKQVSGVDYRDTFARCIQLSSVRLVLIFALSLGLAVCQMGVETADLNPELGEELYLRLLAGLEFAGRRYARLKRVVRGLRPAGKPWHEASDEFAMGYDPRMQKNEQFLYVVGPLCTAFNAMYACKDLGELYLVMGIGVRRAGGDAYLPQREYISTLVPQHGLDGARPALLPMAPGTVLSLSRMIPRSLTELRWDSRSGWLGVQDRVVWLLYLKGTGNHELVRRSTVIRRCVDNALPVLVYTDAENAGGKLTRKSTSG
eukprot:gene8052-biopygen8125